MLASGVRRSLALLGAAIALTACGTPYVAPPSGSLSDVTLVAGAGARKAIVNHLEAGQCSNRKLLGILGPKPSVVAFNDDLMVVPQKTIKIATDVPFVMQFNDQRYGYPADKFCSATVEFTPRLDRRYRVVWRFDSSSCQTSVDTRDASSTEWEKDYSAKFSKQSCLFV